MAAVQIFELDSKEDPVSVLQTGEYIFGRGPLLKCTDRRVSRKHGVITVTDQTATITSTHQNPCFYQAANSATIVILPKDNPVDINDGDKFALLADQFWFRIKISKNGSGDSCQTNGSSSRMANLPSTCVENGGLSPLSFTSAPVSSKISDVLIDPDFLQITQQAVQAANMSSVGAPEAIENATVCANNSDDNDSSDSVDFLQATLKRAHEAGIDSQSNKKAKFDNEKDADENQLLLLLGDLKKNAAMSKSEGEDGDEEVTSKCDGQKDKEVMSEIADEDNNNEPTSTGGDRREVMSESDDDNINVKVKPDTPKKNPYKWKKESPPVSSVQSAHDAELKSMLFSSDEDNENQTNNLNRKVDVSSTSKNVNKDVKLNINNDSTAINKDNNKNQKKDLTDNETDKSDKATQDPNVASTSGSNEKKLHRDHCWYGLECYRKSASHLAEYSHPGDSDYEADPEDDRPLCAFGAACYRRNKDHRQAYKHPNNPQKPPGGGKRPKKKNNKAATPKKRTMRKQYCESSEDDYDLQDPFIGDSGTEYEATSSDDDDSESDSSGASEEETKRLLKEAKKFTRGKKKDKNDDDSN